MSHYPTAKTVNIHMTVKEATLFCQWLEETTTPAPDQNKNVPGRLEDMLTEIITREDVLMKTITKEEP